jgi:hypothetical protein
MSVNGYAKLMNVANVPSCRANRPTGDERIPVNKRVNDGYKLDDGVRFHVSSSGAERVPTAEDHRLLIENIGLGDGKSSAMFGADAATFFSAYYQLGAFDDGESVHIADGAGGKKAVEPFALRGKLGVMLNLAIGGKFSEDRRNEFYAVVFDVIGILAAGLDDNGTPGSAPIKSVRTGHDDGDTSADYDARAFGKTDKPRSRIAVTAYRLAVLASDIADSVGNADCIARTDELRLRCGKMAFAEQYPGVVCEIILAKNAIKRSKNAVMHGTAVPQFWMARKNYGELESLPTVWNVFVWSDDGIGFVQNPCYKSRSGSEFAKWLHKNGKKAAAAAVAV